MALDFKRGLKEATEKLLELANTLTTPIVLIDGRAGSGKSLFASRLADAFFKEQRQAARIVHLDDLYPGWEGLIAGSVYARERILEPTSRGQAASWQIWDWTAGARGSSAEPGNGFREFGGSTALILEGCGALSKASSELASLRIWLESDEKVRRLRFNERDGGKYDEFWGVWAAQEDEFYSSEKSKELAELIIQN
jgi:DNA polymerase III delta prime subunit